MHLHRGQDNLQTNDFPGRKADPRLDGLAIAFRSREDGMLLANVFSRVFPCCVPMQSLPCTDLAECDAQGGAKMGGFGWHMQLSLSHSLFLPVRMCAHSARETCQNLVIASC